jgi:hypothetical protein
MSSAFKWFLPKRNLLEGKTQNSKASRLFPSPKGFAVARSCRPVRATNERFEFSLPSFRFPIRRAGESNRGNFL